MSDLVRSDVKRSAWHTGCAKSPTDKTRLFAITPLAAAVVAALYPAMPAIAQEESAGLEEIIVTATRRELNMQDVAQSITAFSNDDLEQMGIKTMSDYIKAMPSVGLTEVRPGITSLVMRGISTGAREYRLDSTVAVYLDDQAMTTSSQHVSVRAIDMERIETLPGPQSTLFGSSAQAGTLRLITNKPNPNQFSGEIGLDVGSTTGGGTSHDVNGHINIPLIADTLAVRAVAYTSHDAGWVDNVLGTSYSGNFDNSDVVQNDYNEYDTDGGRIAALWNISDRWSTMLTYTTEKTESLGEWETDPSLGEHKIVRFHVDNRQDDWNSTSLTINGDLGFASLSVTGTHFERDFAYDWDNNAYSQKKDRAYAGAYLRYTENCYATNPNYGDSSCLYAGYYAGYSYAPRYYTNYVFSTLINDQQQERDALEIRLQSQGEGKLQWMLGGYYEDVFDTWHYFTNMEENVNTTSWATAQAYAYYYKYTSGYDNLQYPLPPTTHHYQQDMRRTNKQIAVFGEVDYDLTDKLTVTVGARWAQNERDEIDRYQWPEGLPTIGGYGTGGFYGDQGKSDDTFYKLGAQYHSSDEVMFYGLFSQGFRLGGSNSIRAASSGFVPRNYQPDYLDNYEIGMKSQWADNTVQLNVSVFHMRWTDYQVSVFGIGQWWIRGTVNADTAESTGVELSATWQATDNFKIKGSLFRANAEFTSNFFEPSDPTSLKFRKGMAMPNSPDAKAWLSLTYDIPNVFGGDMWVYYDIAYQAETWNRDDFILNNDTRGLAPSWTHSNLSFGLDFNNNLNFTLLVNNLFDEATYSYINPNIMGYADDFPNNTRDLSNRNEGRPRTVWLTMRKGFQ